MLCVILNRDRKSSDFMIRYSSKLQADLPKQPGRPRISVVTSTLRGSNEARSENRQGATTFSPHVKNSNQPCSIGQILPHLRFLLRNEKREKEEQKLNGLIAVFNELVSQEIGSDGMNE